MSSTLISNQQALPNELAIGQMKPSAVIGARSYRCSFSPTNGTVFSPAGMIEISVSPRRNCFLNGKNTYLSFTLTNTNTTAANAIYVDGSAYSVIRSMTVTHGSSRLEEIGYYNRLCQFLIDTQMTQSQIVSHENHIGCQPRNIIGDVARTNTVAGNLTQGGGIVLIGGGTVKRSFSLPLVSGTLGGMMDRACPLSLSDDVVLRLTLESLVEGVVHHTAGTTWTISNVELVTEILELSEEGMQMVRASGANFAEGIYMHSTSYSQYQSLLPAGSLGSQSFLVANRVASCKSLFVLPQKSTYIGDTYCSVSSRCNPNISEYNWRIGQLTIPQRVIKLGDVGGYSAAYVELMRAMGQSISSSDTFCALSRTNYNVANTVDTPSGVGIPHDVTAANYGSTFQHGFALGTCLETFQKGNTILSGLNTLNNSCYFEFVMSAAVAGSYSLLFYALFDQIICLDPFGQLSIRK